MKGGHILEFRIKVNPRLSSQLFSNFQNHLSIYFIHQLRRIMAQKNHSKIGSKGRLTW